VYRWLYDHVAVFQFGRYPSKFFLFGTAALALLAGLGLEVLLASTSASRRGRRALVILGGAAIVGGVALLGTALYWQSHPAEFEAWLRSMLDPQRAAGKDVAAIRAQLTASVRSSGAFLALASLLALAAPYWRRSGVLAFLFLTMIGAEVLPANLRLTPLIN